VAKSQRVASFQSYAAPWGESIPDVSVFRWDRIPVAPPAELQQCFEIHPDWAIEILSPDQSQTKVLVTCSIALNMALNSAG